jgi:hypothetical protein
MAQARDYTGQLVGKQLVLGRSKDKPSGYWTCECQGCGVVTDKWVTYLKKLVESGAPGCRCSWGVGSKLEIRSDGIKEGERFDRLVATGELARHQCGNGKGRIQTFARFKCDCGQTVWKNAGTVRSGATRSCGCIVATKGGASVSETIQGKMFYSAMTRAKARGIPFSITIGDVVVPDRCPVLGIEIAPNPEGLKMWDHSPTLDKIIPGLGYVPGNIAVISWRANRIKGQGTLEEIEAIVRYIKKEARLAA